MAQFFLYKKRLNLSIEIHTKENQPEDHEKNTIKNIKSNKWPTQMVYSYTMANIILIIYGFKNNNN